MVLNLKSTHTRLIMALKIEFQEAFLNDYFSLEVRDTDSSDLSVQIICSSKCQPGPCVLVLIHFNAQLSHNFCSKNCIPTPLVDVLL